MPIVRLNWVVFKTAEITLFSVGEQVLLQIVTVSPWLNPRVLEIFMVVSPAVMPELIVVATLGRDVARVSFTVTKEPACVFKVAGIKRAKASKTKTVNLDKAILLRFASSMKFGFI